MPTIFTNKQLPKRAANDEYRTDPKVAEACLVHSVMRGDFDRPAFTQRGGHLRILDVGAGTGVWGKAARRLWPDAYIVGVEKNKAFRKPRAYDVWLKRDYLLSGRNDREACFDLCFDFIVGNPPFCDAEAMIRESLRWLSGADSRLGFLLPQHFTGGQERGRNLYNRKTGLPPRWITQLMQRPNFEGAGDRNPNVYLFMEWRLRGLPSAENWPDGQTLFDWLDWAAYTGPKLAFTLTNLPEETL